MINQAVTLRSRSTGRTNTRPWKKSSGISASTRDATSFCSRFVSPPSRLEGRARYVRIRAVDAIATQCQRGQHHLFPSLPPADERSRRVEVQQEHEHAVVHGHPSHDHAETDEGPA